MALTTQTTERRQARLHRTGGSQSVVLPGRWLQRLHVTDAVELVDAGDHIEVYPVRPAEGVDVEDLPEFAGFLDFLARTGLKHGETLGNVVDLLEEDADLAEGVEPDL